VRTHEDNDNNNVQDSSDFVDPANELSRLHCNDALDNEQRYQAQVNMPRLGRVIGIRDFAAGNLSRNVR
jgi:hypothetical protein